MKWMVSYAMILHYKAILGRGQPGLKRWILNFMYSTKNIMFYYMDMILLFGQKKCLLYIIAPNNKSLLYIASLLSYLNSTIRSLQCCTLKGASVVQW